MLDITHPEQTDTQTNQYSIWQIVGIWLAAGIPMWILGWVIYPAMSIGMDRARAGLLRLGLLCGGLIWQFLLAMIILYREEGNIRVETVRKRFWLNNPISPSTGKTDKRLWWLLIPFILLLIALEAAVSPINSIWTKAFPFLSAPPGYNATDLFAPDIRPQWIGAWGLLALTVVLSVFNTFLGEEFVFRGVLLPKMHRVFGKWDWVANGIGFGLYHLHQPWGIPGNILDGLVFAFTGRQFRTNWYPIILHSGQSVLIIVLVLGLVLGLT